MVDLEIKQLEIAINAEKHKDKINLLKEQFIENDKLLQQAIALQDENQPQDAPSGLGASVGGDARKAGQEPLANVVCSRDLRSRLRDDGTQNEKYLYLKTLYVVFYKLLLEELFKQLGLEEVEYNIFFSNSIVPYYTNELSACEMKSANVKRVISMLEEKDKK